MDDTARMRGTVPLRLIRSIRGDLDWIVMKCLEKDRNRRYSTSSGLAADLRRHLNMEPVIARPPHTWYLLQRTFRRHRLAFLATAAVITALVGGVLAAMLQAIRAEQAHSEATLALQKVQRESLRGRNCST